MIIFTEFKIERIVFDGGFWILTDFSEREGCLALFSSWQHQDSVAHMAATGFSLFCWPHPGDPRTAELEWSGLHMMLTGEVSLSLSQSTQQQACVRPWYLHCGSVRAVPFVLKYEHKLRSSTSLTLCVRLIGKQHLLLEEQWRRQRRFFIEEQLVLALQSEQQHLIQGK